MLILKPLSIDRSVAGANIPAVTFIAQAGLPARELAHMLDSLVRVSRRVEKSHFVNVIERKDLNSSTLGPLHSRSKASFHANYAKLASRTQSSVEIRLHTQPSEILSLIHI